MMPEKLDSSIVLLRERIEQGMRGSADLILDEFELAGVKGLAFMFDGLVSNTQVSDFLLRIDHIRGQDSASRCIP